MNRESLRYLRFPLMGCAIALVLFLLTLWGGEYVCMQLQQENLQLQQLVRQASVEQSRVQQEQLQAQVNLPAFMKLQERGVLSPEDRLSWVEKLTYWQSVFPFDYQIAEQRHFEALTESPDIEVYSTPVRITASLRDEEQALHLLDDLQSSAGWPVLDYCITQLKPDAEAFRWLSLQCQINWITMGAKE